MKNEPSQKVTELPESQQLYTDVCHIIDETRTRVAVYVNAEVCHTNWLIGKQVVKELSQRLSERYGKGWSEKTLRHCLRTAETFSESDIVYAVRRQFSWTHLRSIMFLEDPLARKF